MPLEELERVAPHQTWNPQASGIEITPPAAKVVSFSAGLVYFYCRYSSDRRIASPVFLRFRTYFRTAANRRFGVLRAFPACVSGYEASSAVKSHRRRVMLRMRQQQLLSRLRRLVAQQPDY